MKTNKMNQKNLTNTAVALLGMTVGYAASGAVERVVSSQFPGNEEVAKLGLLAAGGVGATVIKPSGHLEEGLKFVGLGIAVKQATDLAFGAVRKMITVKPVEERGLVDNIIYGAVGLGCPGCNETRYLAAPSVTFPENDVLEIPAPQFSENRKVSILN